MRVLHQHRRNRLHFRARTCRTRWIIREIDHHPFRLGRNGRVQILGPQLEAVILWAVDGHRHTTRNLRHFGIGNPEGGWDQYLIARINRCHEGVEDALLAAIGDHDFIKRVIKVIIALELPLHRFLEPPGAILRRVFRLTRQRGLMRRFNSMWRCREIRLSGGQADHLDALRGQFPRLDRHDHGSGDGNAVQTFGKGGHREAFLWKKGLDYGAPAA